MARLSAGRSSIRGSLSGRGKIYSFFLKCRDPRWPHGSSSSVARRGPSLAINWPSREADYSLHSVPEIRMSGALPHHSPLDFMQRDKFTFNYNITVVYRLFFLLFRLTLNKAHLVFEPHIRRKQFMDNMALSSSYIVAAVALMRVDPMKH